MKRADEDRPSRRERQANALTLAYRAAVLVFLILILVEARAAHRDAAIGALDAAEVRAEMIKETQPRTPVRPRHLALQLSP